MIAKDLVRLAVPNRSGSWRFAQARNAVDGGVIFVRVTATSSVTRDAVAGNDWRHGGYWATPYSLWRVFRPAILREQ
jgi:hypothetical protein